MRTVIIVALAFMAFALLMSAALVVIASQQSGAQTEAATLQGNAPVSVDGIPAASLRLYTAAARTCPGLSWSVLAAVGKVETDHGRSQLPGVRSGTNHAGAAGPMQFLISTWGGRPKIPIPSAFTGYAADGDGDGWADVYNPADAIFGAARYLCASGAATDIRQALYAYNHSNAYVDQVLALADDYAAKAASPTSGPLPAETPSGPENITARTRAVRDAIRAQFAVPHGIGCYRRDGGIAGGGASPGPCLRLHAQLRRPAADARGDGPR